MKEQGSRTTKQKKTKEVRKEAKKLLYGDTVVDE